MTTSWLSSITILYDNTLEKGVLYDARTNSIVTVTTESAKLLAVMQQNKIAGVLSRDKETIIETKLQNAFLNVQKEFLQPTPIFTEHGKINNLEILIQTGCNLHCKYCFADGGTYGQTTTHFSPEQGRNLIRTLAAQGIRQIACITFFGGEPSIYPDTIQAICEECSQLFSAQVFQAVPNYYMVTNGVSISSKCIQVIRQYNIHLTISLDGPAEINDRLRIFQNGCGSYNYVYNNIKTLREHGIEPALIEATYTSLHEQADYSREDTVTALKSELGVQNIYLCDCNGGNYEPRPESITELINRDNQHLKKLFEENECDDIPAKLLQFIFETSKLLSMKEFSDFLCDVGLKSITVLPTGDVYPCHYFIGNSDFLFGNIFEETFTLDGMSKAAEKKRCFTKLSQKTCKDCWARNFCSRCVFHMYEAQSNDILRNEFAEGCEIIKNRLKKIILGLSNMSQCRRKELYSRIVTRQTSSD